MATQEQNIKDIMEMGKLSSETLVETSQKIETVDKNVNKVGGSIVELHKVTTDMNQDVKHQTDTLNDVNNNQQAVSQKVTEFATLIKDILQGVNGNQESLSELSKALDVALNTDGDKQSAFLDALKNGTSKYAEQLKTAFLKLDETDKHIQHLDPHDVLSSISDKLQSTFDTLEENQTKAVEHHKETMNELASLTESFKDSVSKLDALSEKAAGLSDDFETSISRMANIELKLNETLESDKDVEGNSNSDKTENEGE